MVVVDLVVVVDVLVVDLAVVVVGCVGFVLGKSVDGVTTGGSNNSVVIIGFTRY